MDPKELRTFAKSHRFIVFLTGVGFLIIAIVVFEAGVFVGFHRAEFAASWERNYARDFGDPRGTFGMPSDTVPNGHGADGRIVSVAYPAFVVAGQNEAEKTVTISSSTVIRIGHDATSSDALKKNMYVVIIGDPDASGAVAAELIRVLPPPQDMQAGQ